MQIDDISFNDISIFNQEEEFSIFHKLNFTLTAGGKEWLRYYFNKPHSDIERIKGTQTIIRTLMEHVQEWPTQISNGTLLVMEKFLDYSLDTISARLNFLNACSYRLLHSADYSMVKYSIPHFADFFKGLQQIYQLLKDVDLPKAIKIYIDRIGQILSNESFTQLVHLPRNIPISITENLQAAHYIKDPGRAYTRELIDIFYRLDAWYAMAKAVKTYNLSFPEFIEQETPLIEAKGLYHILLPKPVPYDLQMNPANNFIFLTGANMAGKSTLIKSVGAAVFLAHLGMGVPAQNLKLTLFDGLISNINVVDNITKGESFFYNEVQRIKNTITKINNKKKWLVLIDELFKGTNVQDAMKCSLAVINGLLKIKNSLFILSTHLYEIGDELKDNKAITFRYFETDVTGEQLSFSYQLKEGISNDRIGYVILKREKVVEMLENIGNYTIG